MKQPKSRAISHSMRLFDFHLEFVTQAIVQIQVIHLKNSKKTRWTVSIGHSTNIANPESDMGKF